MVTFPLMRGESPKASIPSRMIREIPSGSYSGVRLRMTFCFGAATPYLRPAMSILAVVSPPLMRQSMGSGRSRPSSYSGVFSHLELRIRA